MQNCDYLKDLTGWVQRPNTKMAGNLVAGAVLRHFLKWGNKVVSESESKNRVMGSGKGIVESLLGCIQLE
jgi:hypothetical protein